MSIDEKPLTIIVSEALDPRVRRKLESQLLPEVKTQEEFDTQLKADEKAKQEQEEAKAQMANNPEPPKDDNKSEQKPAEQNNQADKSGDSNEQKQPDQAAGNEADPFSDSKESDPFGSDNSGQGADQSTPPAQANDNAPAPATGQTGGAEQTTQAPANQPAQTQPAPAQTPPAQAAQPQANQAPAVEPQQADADPFANSKAADAGDENPFSANEDENASNDQFVKQVGGGQQPTAKADNKPSDDAKTNDDPFADAGTPPADGEAKTDPEPPKEEDNGSNSGGTDPFDSNVAFEHADLQTTEGLAALFGNRPPPRLSMETMQQDEAEAKVNLAKRLMVIDPPQAGLSNSTNLMIQMLKDPENTLAIINYDDAPTVDAKVKLTKYEEQLKDRGVQTFKDAPTAVEYINQLYNDLKTTTSGGE